MRSSLAVQTNPPALVDLKDCGLVYLATNYTKHPRGPHFAYIEAKQLVCDIYKRAGFYVYSPIAYGHPLTQGLGLDPFDHEAWMAFDLPQVMAAKVLLVGMLEGWEHSHGIADEISKFHSRPRFYINPQTLELSNV